MCAGRDRVSQYLRATLLCFGVGQIGTDDKLDEQVLEMRELVTLRQARAPPDLITRIKLARSRRLGKEGLYREAARRCSRILHAQNATAGMRPAQDRA